MSRFFVFGKNQKLKSSKAIDRLFRSGKRYNSEAFAFRYIILDIIDEQSPYKFGVTCSKRNLKRAVQRNRVKRIMREAIRLERYAIVDAASGRYLLDRGFHCMMIYNGRSEDLSLVSARKAVRNFLSFIQHRKFV